jgi:hypothetical protein
MQIGWFPTQRNDYDHNVDKKLDLGSKSRLSRAAAGAVERKIYVTPTVLEFWFLEYFVPISCTLYSEF